MNNDLATLAALGVTRTRFTSIILNANDSNPTVLGQGACKAVLLKANYYQPNAADSIVGDDPACVYFYYGDAQQQSWEYLVIPYSLSDPAGTPILIRQFNTRASELIICQDLNEVWLRYPVQAAATTGPLTVEAMIYE